MGRGGVGGSSSGGRSSSGHSGGSRSVSGHRSSSSSSHSRGGLSNNSRSSYSNSSRSSYSGGGYHGPSYSHHHHHHHSSTYSSGPMDRGSVKVLLVVLAIFAIWILISSSTELFSGGMSVRYWTGLGMEPMEPWAPYDMNCVVDEDGWFDVDSDVVRGLESFYKDTGIQPYVVIKAPDSSLVTDEQKEKWADEWYANNIHNSGGLLYVYFAEDNPDIQGYSVLVRGSGIKAFFVDQAVYAFWDIYDSLYYDNTVSEEDLIINTFSRVAKICLSKDKITFTSFPVLGIVAIVALGVVVFIIVVAVILFVRKRKREAEAARAAETQAILNTPIEQLGQNDELLNKYSDDK